MTATGVGAGTIQVPTTGTYEIVATLEFYNLTENVPDISYWVQTSVDNINWIDVANSSRFASLSIQSLPLPFFFFVAPLDIQLNLTANTYFRLMWSSTVPDVKLYSLPVLSTPYNAPATPSAVVNVKLLETTINYTLPPAIQATYYKTSNQNLVNGSTDITFDATATWNNDSGYITHTSGSTDFTVVTPGLYQLEWNASVTANGATWNTANNKVISIDITRSPTAEQIVLSQAAVCATTTNYTQSLSSTYNLNAGDVLNCRIQGNYATATPFATALSGTFDLNTWFSWRYVGEGSVSATPPPVIQAAGTTALTPANQNTTYILTSGATQNFTTAALTAGNAGAVWYVKNAFTADIAIQHNGVAITGVTATLHHFQTNTNSSTQILYWNGTDLSML